MIVEQLVSSSGRRVLERRLGEDRARAVVAAAIEGQRKDSTQQLEATRGGRLMVKLAAMTAALYRALVAEGLDKKAARRQTAEVTAHVYARMATLPWLLARVSTRSPLVRLRRATNTFRHFPFGPPAYEMEDKNADERTVAFDVRRCPVANYFRSHGLAELCVESFCDLDFELARCWGASLERTMTLAGGDSHCDFRWRLEVSEEEAGS